MITELTAALRKAKLAEATAKADTLDKLQEVVSRMDKRKPDLSDEQNQQLMELALAREAQLAPATEDPFADD